MGPNQDFSLGGESEKIKKKITNFSNKMLKKKLMGGVLNTPWYLPKKQLKKRIVSYLHVKFLAPLQKLTVRASSNLLLLLLLQMMLCLG